MTKRYKFFIVLHFVFSYFFVQAAFAIGTCCELHEGLSYCEKHTAHWVCKDGTLALKCGCMQSILHPSDGEGNPEEANPENEH